MTRHDQDPTIHALFETSGHELTGEVFTDEVMSQTDKLQRRVIIRRLGVGFLLSFLGIPLQDFGLALAEVLVLSLIDLDNYLLAQLLAPINTVGGLLSIFLLGLRIAHKRIFS